MNTAVPSQSKITPSAIIVISAIALMIGLTIGGITGLIAGAFYIPFLFPIGEAFGVITGATLFDRVAKRFGSTLPQLTLSIAVASTALITYGTYHYVEYSRLRAALSNNEPMSRAVDRFLIEETGQPGFLGGLILQANTGFELSLFYGPQGAIVARIPYSIKGIGVWLYWLVEFQ